MKRIHFVYDLLFFLVLTLFLNSCKSSENLNVSLRDTSKNSLDWIGTYRGELQIEGNESSIVAVRLNADSTFVLWKRSVNNKETFEEKGKFSWNSTQNRISLGAYNFLVGEGELVLLNKNNATTDHNEKNPYVLYKITSTQTTTPPIDNP